MTDSEKLALIERIATIQAQEQDNEDGNRYLADPFLALEAIGAILGDEPGNGSLRMFKEAGPQKGSGWYEVEIGAAE